MVFGPFFFKVHFVTLWLWIIIRTWIRADTHSGFQFPWSLELAFPMYAGPDYQLLHTETIRGNFASILTYLDTVFATRAEDIELHQHTQ